MRYAHCAKICEKCGKEPNTRQSHIRDILTWLHILNMLHINNVCIYSAFYTTYMPTPV